MGSADVSGEKVVLLPSPKLIIKRLIMPFTKGHKINVGRVRSEEFREKMRKGNAGQFSVTHGMSRSRFYKIFKGMNSRCNRVADISYKYSRS